ncbi:MAG: hypothetical protein ACREM1_24785 [Longimicrobiales bacterium]
MPSRRHTVGVFACLLLFWLVLPASPDVARGPESLAGRYVILPEQGDEIEAAIDKAVSEMSFLTRGIARGRLRRTNPPPESLAIGVQGTDVVIQQDARIPVRAAWNGTPVEWTNDEGEELEVSMVWEDPVLRQVFVADDGQRVNEFWSSEGGRILTMRVVVSSPRLSEDVVYQLAFGRDSAESGGRR